MRQWHSLTPRQVLEELDASPGGLTGREAAARLEARGPNRLPQPPRPGLWARLWGQLKDPMILVLLAAAGLSLLSTGGEDWVEAAIILGIVVLNAVISLSQEDSAHRALEALRQMSAPAARAVRDGQVQRVDAARLVPGDVILLEAGDLVPADGRILECAGLSADESAVTGESLPVSKAALDRLPPDTPLGDRRNTVIASTVITGGRARCVVTGTGTDTEVGRIAHLLLSQEEGETPLQRKMGEISKKLSLLCLGVCAVMFGVGLLYGAPLLEMFLSAVSLAVAAIPEGLPAIVAIVLALGVQRMAARHAIVKRLPAVETLGCAGVICSDKTGTLTENRMTVTRVWSRGEPARRAALAAGALCSDVVPVSRPGGGAGWSGDPTEAALVRAAEEEGLDKGALEDAHPRVAELPFDSRRKRMTTVHRRRDGTLRVLVKGAPDVLLARCTHILDGPEGRAVPLTPALRRQVEGANAAMAEGALRVLACAGRDIDRLPPGGQEGLAGLEEGLTFLGLVGMMDPPRREVKRAVAQCHAAGIRPVMITGDHKLTALAVARELDIFRPGDLAATGADLDFMSQELLEREVHRFTVYARVSPEHKLRIVRAWQARGKVVAMTGDGVNDAPALKAADIGCAMGISGTDVAKGAADMILTDDDFATIVRAVEQGRGIYANIRKAIHYLLSCNIGEMLALFLATLLGLSQRPLEAVQLLWLNLVTDSLPALALGLEPVEPGVMARGPRDAGQPLFTRPFTLRLLWQGALVGGLALTAYWLGGWVLAGPARADGVANTMAFATLTFCQLFHAFDVRSEEQSLFRLGLATNPAMVKAFLAGAALQLAVLCFPPLMAAFSVCPLTPAEWGAVLALSLTPVLVCEGEKALRRRRRR